MLDSIQPSRALLVLPVHHHHWMCQCLESMSHVYSFDDDHHHHIIMFYLLDVCSNGLYQMNGNRGIFLPFQPGYHAKEGSTCQGRQNRCGIRGGNGVGG